MHGSPDASGQKRGIDSPVAQGSLFDQEADSGNTRSAPPQLVSMPSLTAESTLGACRLPYRHHLQMTDRSANTITCFLSDLSLLITYLGSERRVGSIGLDDLDRWRWHLRQEGKARLPDERPRPKTVARRMTFLKNFFGWLAAEGVLHNDPTVGLEFKRPQAPIGDVLFDDEVERLEEAAAEDTRCRLLVMLLLGAGLKKEEVMGLRLIDVDLSDCEAPAVEVHFPGQDKRWRERRLALPAAWTSAYEDYVGRYKPVTYVFECTGRNLNYVLTAAVRRAGLERRDRPVTLQMLRDIYAIRQLRGGVPPEVLREKLGLSEEAWYETAYKYRRLAFPV